MNKILETTEFVVKNSGFVKINRERVIDFSNDFEHGSVKHWLGAAPFDFSELGEEERLHFIFVFNALSFCYWGEPKWTVEYADKEFDGSWGMITALSRSLKEEFPLLDFSYCSKISRKDLSKILRANVEIPLFEERWKILQEIGDVFVAKYGGKAKNLLEEAGGDAQKLLEIILKNFSSFNDVSIYKGREIYFYKRAQLLVGDIYQFFDGKSFGKLENIGQITACADYKLPQILRRYGMLEYSPEFASKIDNKIEISHNSEEEVEIRANTIWVVEFIKNEVKKRNPEIESCQINDHLWLATQEKFPDDKPYHRTRTMAY